MCSVTCGSGGQKRNTNCNKVDPADAECQGKSTQQSDCTDDKNEKFRSLKAKKIVKRRAEDGPYLGFNYKSLISDSLRSGKRSQRKIL